MKILKFKMFESNQNQFKIEWSLEDISGDCSPSRSTTIDSGEFLFDDLLEKDEMVEKVKDESGIENTIKCRLYISLFKRDNGEWIFIEDVD